MPVRAYELVDGGVVLVCSASGLPLPVSVNLFTTEEQAAWFIASLSPRDARTIEEFELQRLATQWVGEANLAEIQGRVYTPEMFAAMDAIVASAEPGSVCGEYPAVGRAPSPRFPVTYCSQCGGEFGPGDSGYSHCEDHRADADAPEPGSVCGDYPAVPK